MAINTEMLFEAIQALSKDNLVKLEEVKAIIEKSVFKIVHDKYDPDAELELIMNEESKEFSLVNHNKLVVNDDEFESKNGLVEIPLSRAKTLVDGVKAYDTVSDEIDFKAHPEIIQNVRQLITQAIKERKKEAVFEKHQSLQGEMIKATVLSVTRTYVILALDDGTTAFMPEKLRNKKIHLANGQRTDVYVEEVLRESKDSQIVVSNGSPTLVKRVLEKEVPEIAEGIVEILAISRTAGLRTKIAVKSNDENVDPVGAIIGSGGSRIKSIIQELDGEKVDVILWAEDENTFIANALSPAKVISIVDKGDVTRNQKIVITPNKHQTLAIGKFGSNAKLAVELTRTRMDIISIEDAINQNIEFSWNGNVSPEEVEAIESGEVLARPSAPRRNNTNNNAQPKRPAQAFDNIMDEVDTFKEEMDTEVFEPVKPTKVKEVDTAFPTMGSNSNNNDDEFDFDDLDLEKMQDNFAFDTEVSDDFEIDSVEEDEDQDFDGFEAEDYDFSDMEEFEENL